MAAIILIVFILCVVIGINMTVCADTKKHGEKVSHAKWRRLTWAAGCILMVLVLITSCIAVIPTGYTGIVTSFGKVKDTTFEAGINFKTPWEAVIEMDNREQRINYNLEAFSSDIQEVQVQLSVNLNIDKSTAMNLYREVGTDYISVLVAPRVLEDVKATISDYTAEQLIANRNVLSEKITAMLRDDLERNGINIIKVAVENIDFTDAFTNAVEAKQVATQEKQRAQTQQEQQTMEAQQAAERRRIAAEADADVAKIAAEADLEVVKIQADAALFAGEREAEMNKRISEALTTDLIKYYWIKQWDGELPTVTSDDFMPIFDMSSVLSE